ncbi:MULTISPECIES: alpha/beta hydrolase [unclassified Bradyrhizobium]|uniref:alpha/beta hydrolase n=1 Tax=unclassified Bradyrhizobium TaxID=2631580 RepID=UPI001CD7CAD0|nr:MULTISPECIES: alpha/beta hydrolase [unclassified Bradyrhizobium]MCA1427881.1 alpha/beta hydrolase [Bradyrhizobium sp. NBAIM16]MCA1474284.1 alpha/beta hydrolase [Bradyrhizobium sp. NBAIM08]MCA1504884.1 alpha/beta hydrolase [Bradyrhizobium sp. NBAIM02]MCA1512106.1 alpha/beta hydrolase [Bradyrhizobium sp. NBAIM01]
MAGAAPKLRADDRADRTMSGRHDRALRAALISVMVPLSLTLVQCGKAPDPAALAANSQANVQVVAKTNSQSSNAHLASGDTFEDRFPAPQFRERFPSASESFLQRQMSDFSPKRAVQSQPEQASYKVASLEPQVPYKRPAREDLTTLVSMKSSAFPYFGNNPASDAPFLNISKGDRRGHRSYSGRVYWQDETYSDSRVLVHVPEHFDLRKPGVIVVFFHGNGATLERDVRDRQMVPKQVTDSGANAILLAPQMAVDAADSSAGKFWQPGGFKRFMAESADHLARLTGDPNSARAFANMPIVIVGYSGGFLPTAWSLEVGGISDRVRGVVLLDAVYGEMDKFASWIENHRSGFFVSAYTRHTARRDRELMSMLRQKGISVAEDMDGPLRPGSVVFVETGEGITHRDYVTRAWTRDPLKDVLVKMAATPSLALTRVASTNP